MRLRPRQPLDPLETLQAGDTDGGEGSKAALEQLADVVRSKEGAVPVQDLARVLPQPRVLRHELHHDPDDGRPGQILVPVVHPHHLHRRLHRLRPDRRVEDDVAEEREEEGERGSGEKPHHLHVGMQGGDRALSEVSPVVVVLEGPAVDGIQGLGDEEGEGALTGGYQRVDDVNDEVGEERREGKCADAREFRQ
eukprot:470270-Hanusia_phi.AAC.2